MRFPRFHRSLKITNLEENCEYTDSIGDSQPVVLYENVFISLHHSVLFVIG